MKNKKESESVPLRRIASMRVISEPVEMTLKSMREVLNERPELVPLMLNLVNLVARKGNLDFLSNAQDDLPLRVAVLEQHVKDLQNEAEQRRKSATQQQENQTNENEVIAERFSKLWTGKVQGRRLMPEGVDLMRALFAKGKSDAEIEELSGMKLAGVERRREEWERLRTIKAQSGPRKNHDHCRHTLTAANSEVASDDLSTKGSPERASRGSRKEQMSHSDADQAQKNESNLVDDRVTPSSSLHHEKLKSSAQNSTVQQGEKVDRREPRSGCTSLQRTEMANMLIEWTFRRNSNMLTLNLIGDHFGISRDAVKKHYLSVLKEAGLLDKDRRITHEEVLEAFASKRKRLP